MSKSIISLGIMSGTSLDGVDLAICRFTEEQDIWHYEILYAETIPYDASMKNHLSEAHCLSGVDFLKAHNNYGRFLGSLCQQIIANSGITPDIISSHGHTIFHQPEKKFTFQMGSGASILAETGITTVCDFRITDVALGGQGAPLVPIGDQLLFHQYPYCLNLGGIANISYKSGNTIHAWDICPANMALNYIAGLEGKEYDLNGDIAHSGSFSQDLFDNLNSITYYSQFPPKSLGKEWFTQDFLPHLIYHPASNSDKLHTLCRHIAFQISHALKMNPTAAVLSTGGGSHNDFLIKMIREYADNSIIIPDKQTINFKEALIFAFLGVLRTENKINCLSSVTGAPKDSVCGIIYK
jgi:anhydro-N-acetylmuramic acid kinase